MSMRALIEGGRVGWLKVRKDLAPAGRAQSVDFEFINILILSLIFSY